jgi:hypothetical protein
MMRFSTIRSVLMFLALYGVLTSTQALAEEWVYKVKPGDNLWNLSAKHLASMRFLNRLATLNNVPNPKRLKPGSTFRVPMDWLRLDPTRANVVAVSGQVTAVDGDGDAVELTTGDGARHRLTSHNGPGRQRHFGVRGQDSIHPARKRRIDSGHAFGIRHHQDGGH